MPRIKNTDNNENIILLVWTIFERQGRFKGVCEICSLPLKRKKAEIHHTKYDGATLKDLMIICHKCNTQQVNRYLV